MGTRLRRAITVPLVTVLALAISGDVATAKQPLSSWPQRVVVPESVNVAAHTVTDGVLYQLVSGTLTPIRGPYRLETREIRTGAVRRGPRFPVGNLALASGYLWVYGSSGMRPRLFEVDPRILKVVRSINLPTAQTENPWLALSAGPDRSLWVGTSQMLRRIDTASGRVLATVAPPAGLAVASLSLDPVGTHLYVSMAHIVKGGLAGWAVIEYDSRSGRELAQAQRGLITYSVAGASVTAVPGGVWASFRTGMLGLTIHLRQSDLAMIPPPGQNVAQSPANTLFHWPMSASTIYAGGALWITNESGIIACLNPLSGQVRASEHIQRSPSSLAVHRRRQWARRDSGRAADALLGLSATGGDGRSRKPPRTSGSQSIAHAVPSIGQHAVILVREHGRGGTLALGLAANGSAS
jgi:hypothetical protein